jgi:hypothetical protein
MLIRVLLTVWVCASSAAAQFQAQNGWGLPRRVSQTSITQGLALDTETGRVVVAEQNGIVARSLEGNAPETVLLETQGVRNLVGVGSGQSFALAWYSRSLTEESAVWAWFGGQAVKLAQTPFSDVAIASLNGQPVVAYVVTEGENTSVYVHPWNAQPVLVHRTALNVGALGLGVTPGGRIGVIFAEGYRNAQDEKYDAILVTGTLNAGFQTTRVGAAVYSGREQQFTVAVKKETLMPVWWYETDEQQRVAALTKRHFPRLALWDGSRVVEFAAPGRPVGQLENALYYTLGADLWALDLESLQSTRQIVAPDAPARIVTGLARGVRAVAWQSLGADGFASNVWVADTREPYQPTFVDRVSIVMGWNPWYPAQSVLGQTLLAAIIAAGAVMLTAPFVWFAAHQFRFNAIVAVLIGAVFVVTSRLVSGSLSTPGWGFEALLTPPWWTVPLGVGLGMLAVWVGRRRLNGTELGPTIASSLVVMLGVFVMVFSRAGFIRF